MPVPGNQGTEVGVALPTITLWPASPYHPMMIMVHNPCLYSNFFLCLLSNVTKSWKWPNNSYSFKFSDTRNVFPGRNGPHLETTTTRLIELNVG